jgi:hypothetical protein
MNCPKCFLSGIAGALAPAVPLPGRLPGWGNILNRRIR